MNIGKSDNVNDGYRAGSQKAFEVWKTMHKKDKALLVSEGDQLQTPEDAMDSNKIVDEDTTAGVGISGLGGMDSTDGMLFGKKANKVSVKDTSKKKVWSPPRQLSLAVLKPY